MIRGSHVIGIAFTASLLMPLLAHAQTLRITPALIDASHSVEEALETHKSHASTTIEGQGGTLTIEYRAGEPLEVYMVPLKSDDTYVPTDYVHFTLPMTDEGTVAIDLTVSPGFTMKSQRWMMTLLGKDETTNAAFTGITFSDDYAPNTLTIGLRHFLRQEPYTPSSYHALRGYRFFGISFTKTLGLLAVALILLACIAIRNGSIRTYALGILLIASLLYQARFSLDLGSITVDHLTEYAQGTYDEAGSIHVVASVLRGIATSPETKTVYVCRDGTNFKEKLLRYFAYPMRVSASADAAQIADYAVVMNKFKWGFTTNVTKDESFVTLTCGDVNRKAQKLSGFPSGELLFKLLPS